ncbi:hypothetical protein D3C72_2389690 [compost metagenome]
MTNFTDTLSNAVDKFIQLVILLFEKFMLSQEVDTFYIPVCITGFGVQNIFVGQ